MPLSQGFILTITSALLSTLDLDRVLYVMLAGVTASDGIGFDRAVLLLADPGRRVLRGRLAIGTASREEADRIWQDLQRRHLQLGKLTTKEISVDGDAERSMFCKQAQRLSVPLPLPTPDMDQPWLALLHTVFERQLPVIDRGSPITLADTAITLEQYAAVPLVVDGRPLGVLLVDNHVTERPVISEELASLATVANLAALAAERARLHEDISRRAQQDALTGLLNRRHFAELFERRFGDSVRYDEPLSVAVIDVDHFKATNDNHGHLVGDRVLCELAATLKGRLRQGDLAGRLGGDELASALPRATANQAGSVAEDIRAQVAHLSEIQELPPCTISIGVAERCLVHVNATSLLMAADDALYAAKRGGRNRVEFAPNGTVITNIR